ncbi:hypothetical protein ACFY3O_26980 [Streptomyces sp. NPDC001046]|uniref:hypothetical protein n=1 Tax=unclassified Streptomyces TaxID=2593676 RepID=UPI00363B02AB
MSERKGRPLGNGRTARTGRSRAGRSRRASGRLVRMYRRYHAWRAPFPPWIRIGCDVLFWALTAAAAYVVIGSLCGAVLVALPLLGFLGLAASKEHDDGIDWSDHRMGGQPRNPGPRI